MNAPTITSLPLPLTALVAFLATGCITETYYLHPEADDSGNTSTGDEEGESSSTTYTWGDGDGDTTGDGDGDGDGGLVPDPEGCVSALDILVVLDNSGSMGQAQANFVGALSALIDPLDDAGVDWRLGVTTSDNGNPWCSQGQNTPEAGRLVMSSCRQRLDDFSFNGGQIDATDLACNDLCGLDNIDILPTTTEVDPSPSPRPWIESIGGQTNVGGASTLEALACAVPMGIDGCGFESQLESAYQGMLRSQISLEPSYGFTRSGASLLVLIVSDEADCSHDSEWSEIFEADGNKAFWNDPNDAFPTSAVCWRAGVQCSGDPIGYDSCDVADKTVEGAPAQDPDDAVLYPVAERYGALVADLEQAKQELQPAATVQVSLIAGTAPDGDTVYQAGQDAQFVSNFGIGAGCDNGSIKGVPPVRMRDLSSLSGGQQRSICAADQAGELAAIVAPFVNQCE